MYSVTLDKTYTGLRFEFRNFGDAMNFAGMAIENGTYDGVNGPEKVSATIEEVTD